MNHFDAYRLRNEDDWYMEGFNELLYTDAVSVIEWPANVLAALPHNVIEIHLTFIEQGEARQIDIHFPGARETADRGNEVD